MGRLALIIALLAVQTLQFGCAAGVRRQGYSVADKPVPADCRVLVLGYVPFDPSRMERLGRISTYDTGLSLYCDEEYVLNLMMKEACMLGADIVNITDEKFPDWWSTCYRAKADFIRLTNREEVAVLKSDPHYDPARVRERSQETWMALQDAIAAGLMGGVVGAVAK